MLFAWPGSTPLRLDAPIAFDDVRRVRGPLLSVDGDERVVVTCSGTVNANADAEPPFEGRLYTMLIAPDTPTPRGAGRRRRDHTHHAGGPMIGELTVQGHPISALAANFGTPMYLYDGDVLRETYRCLRDRLDPRVDILYSAKANPNVSICAVVRSLGAGIEVSSLAEPEKSPATCVRSSSWRARATCTGCRCFRDCSRTTSSRLARPMRLGIDLAARDELEGPLARMWFLRFAFADSELAAAAELAPSRRAEFLTGRFAAKEAVLKVRGTGLFQGVVPRHIAVLRPVLLVAVPFGLRAPLLGVVLGLMLIALLATSLAAPSYTLGVATRSEESLAPLLNSVTVPLLLLSGILLPMSLAPGWLARSRA